MATFRPSVRLLAYSLPTTATAEGFAALVSCCWQLGYCSSVPTFCLLFCRVTAHRVLFFSPIFRISQLRDSLLY
ncbi:hypothetical protein B0H14DRAFT_2812936 [Mycena olivaceomarginata]|nr:hypothetical protein B0H14DRAFT_2937698 [Mycena olivaceomarginata]KAJ7827844.1 hypothetical protein B0H14DRAFT_2812936 [Mycena olivaceomarginata]